MNAASKEGMSSSSDTLHDQLQQSLSNLLTQIDTVQNLLSDSTEVALPRLQVQLSQCQSSFQKIVSYLSQLDLSPATEQRTRPAQTEAYRLLRLINVDAMRLATAKQPKTAEDLRSRLLNQSEKLQGFIRVIAEAIAS